MSFHFVIKHHGDDKLGLREILQRYANQQWFADHYDPDQAAALLMDRFNRAIATEMQLIEVKVTKGDGDSED